MPLPVLIETDFGLCWAYFCVLAVLQAEMRKHKLLNFHFFILKKSIEAQKNHSCDEKKKCRKKYKKRTNTKIA